MEIREGRDQKALLYQAYVFCDARVEPWDLYPDRLLLKVSDALSLFHLYPVTMSTELDIEKFAGSDHCSATTGSTLTPSHVDGSEHRSSISTSAGACGGK